MSEHPKNNKLIYVSIGIAILLISAALLFRRLPAKPQVASTTTKKLYSMQELAKNNGKNSSECYVAVEGKVYKIEQGLLWKNGEHTTSEGLAHCGKDLTSTIGKSPHGKSKLEALEVVGTLKK